MESNAASLAATYAVRLIGSRTADAPAGDPGLSQDAGGSSKPVTAPSDGAGPVTIAVSGPVRRYLSRRARRRAARSANHSRQ
jgi:hypothetical protein